MVTVHFPLDQVVHVPSLAGDIVSFELTETTE